MSSIDRWHDEVQSAWIYRAISVHDKDPRRAKLFRELATKADEQAAILLTDVKREHRDSPTFSPSVRAKVAVALAQRFGVVRTRGILSAVKVRGMSALAEPPPAECHPMPTSVADIAEHHHRTGAGGAFSMAAGEWVSVRSQRELFEHQIGEEREELERYPDEEAEELALIYEARGVPLEDARAMTRKLVKDPVRALDTLAREELGLNPDNLGSPWGAAVYSFVAFAIGASLPLLPFLFPFMGERVTAACVLSGTALFAVGAVISLFSGKNAWIGGLRMLAIGAAAGAATWGIGRLLGVAIS